MSILPSGAPQGAAASDPESALASNEHRGADEQHRALTALARQAKEAARALAVADADVKTSALEHIAAALEHDAEQILAANAIDVEAAGAQGVSKALIDRLRLDRSKIATMAAQVRAVAALADPVGRVLEATQLDDRLELHRVSCPLGVILAVVEARPDAVTQIAALALKSGNAVLLKAGAEADRTARTIVDVIHRALIDHTPLPAQAVTLVHGRAAVDTLLQLDDLIDLVVPRGSTALVRSIMARTRIPVLGHAAGVCHVYVDAAADVPMAIDIVLDAKVQYPAACNSVETVLVHAAVAPRLLDALAERLTSAGVEVRGCERTRSHVTAREVRAATPDDWGCEYGDLIVAIRVVDDIEEAVAHITRYGSSHTEAIVTADPDAAAYFLGRVDAAGVFHNASTRFADGYRYGLGAEVGISTSKLHARGPVGLAGLTTYKYVLYGDGHTVAPYVGPGARPFRHAPLKVPGA